MHELESIAVIIKPRALLPSKIDMNATIEKSHATVVNVFGFYAFYSFRQTLWRPFILRTGDALGGIQELLTCITMFRLPLIGCHRLLRHF